MRQIVYACLAEFMSINAQFEINLPSRRYVGLPVYKIDITPNLKFEFPIISHHYLLGDVSYVPNNAKFADANWKLSSVKAMCVDWQRNGANS